MSRPSIEEVAIDSIHVGDYIHVDRPGGPACTHARCVLAKVRATLVVANRRIEAWCFELSGGESCWRPRGARVWRHGLAS